MCREYNGWANKPTWCVSLWLGNEEWSDRDLNTKARELIEKMNESYSRIDAEIEMAEYISGVVEEMNPVSDEASMMADILGWALAIVDYDRIAEGYLESAGIDEKMKQLVEEEEE